MNVTDTLDRPLHDLRISVTDRCNFRCTYCMPKEVFGRDYPFLPRDELLSFEEITRVTRVFVDLGVDKVRLTGGEPLLRRDFEKLVEMLARIDDDLNDTLTTNGALLAHEAAGPRRAGLTRVTVSLDSLDDATFRSMNDVDFPVARVLGGIDAAANAGLAGEGRRRGEARPHRPRHPRIARRFHGTGHVVRFIEFMDVGATNGWRMEDVVTAAEIVAASAPSCRSSRWRPHTAARSPSATATSTERARSASSHRSPSPSAATARARDSRPTESCTPASSEFAATTCERSCAQTRPTRLDEHHPSGLDATARTATPSSATRTP